ncbi:MAG: tetratricopeptide repeat protein, partial [Paraprevotella sp.]|nr:tetratricopeptide repeat protein [Paraprevotella sp.]
NAPTYESAYRGKVQNRHTELRPEPSLFLTYYTDKDDFQRKIFNADLEKLNRCGVLAGQLILTTHEVALDEDRIQKHLASIQTLTGQIARDGDNALLYFARSVDEYLVQDFETALSDINRSIELDSTSVLSYYMRMQIRVKNQEARSSEKSETSRPDSEKWTFDDSRSEYQAALEDCEHILSQSPDFAGCYYDKGNIYMQMNLWPEAIAAYTRAVDLNADFAEAYYNRGVAYILSGNHSAGVADLSRAGERGLYKAYNLIKRYRDKVPGQSE